LAADDSIAAMIVDILAHGLWAAAGGVVLQRKLPLSHRALGAVVVLAILPDLPQLFPLVAWAAYSGSLQSIYAYATATPGTEPWLPPLVQVVVHHLHCIMHSVFVAGAVTLLAWHLQRQWIIPLLGWWSHIVIDTFTHSADYYAVPVLYPFSYQGFDGIAWNTPSFMLINYAALTAVWILLWQGHYRHKR
jgi:hypothetical protein